MASIKDIYMNFYNLSVTTETVATALAEGQHHTAMGPSMNIAWEIHSAEVFFPPIAAVTAEIVVAVSTRRGLAAMPELNDKGLVALWRMSHLFSGSVGATQREPQKQNWLPPMLLAAPNLSVYAQASVDTSWTDDAPIPVRIGFTMVTLDTPLYQELFQTWNFAD
jgi:hypothetical protein